MNKTDTFEYFWVLNSSTATVIASILRVSSSSRCLGQFILLFFWIFFFFITINLRQQMKCRMFAILYHEFFLRLSCCSTGSRRSFLVFLKHISRKEKKKKTIKYKYNTSISTYRLTLIVNFIKSFRLKVENKFSTVK